MTLAMSPQRALKPHADSILLHLDMTLAMSPQRALKHARQLIGLRVMTMVISPGRALHAR